MKRILTTFFVLLLAAMPTSFGDDNPFLKAERRLRPFWPGMFHCNGVPVTVFSKGFWVSRDWQCPHYGFSYTRGFYPYAYPYDYGLMYGHTWMYGAGLYPDYYPHPYMYGFYPANPQAGEEEPWYKFIQRYLKEHPEQAQKKSEK